MKHPRFECLGDKYPSSLEEQFDRILIKIEQLWDTAEIDDYFSDLIIDKRGGRRGFPKDVLDDILRLRDFRELETLRKAEICQDAIRELEKLGTRFDSEHFFQALNHGDKVLIDLFVRGNFNIHMPDADGTPPILIALKKGYTVIAQILLNAGADVDATDRIGLTPLLLACGKTTQGYKAIAEMLIKKGAHINVRDRLGHTPLLLALSGGTVEIAELLIERGADISPRTRNGQTALSLAEKAGNTKIVALLLSKGAHR